MEIYCEIIVVDVAFYFIFG